MLAEFITRMAWRFPRRVIYGTAGPYLTRFVVFRSKYLKVFIHCFHRSDEDPQLHNHPWKLSASLIVSGGYREERRTRDGGIRVKDFRPGSINIIRANDYHRVDLHVPETWTVFISGQKTQSWGFWDRETKWFVPWRDFIRAKGMTPMDDSV